MPLLASVAVLGGAAWGLRAAKKRGLTASDARRRVADTFFWLVDNAAERMQPLMPQKSASS